MEFSSVQLLPQPDLYCRVKTLQYKECFLKRKTQQSNNHLWASTWGQREQKTPLTGRSRLGTDESSTMTSWGWGEKETCHKFKLIRTHFQVLLCEEQKVTPSHNYMNELVCHKITLHSSHLYVCVCVLLWSFHIWPCNDMKKFNICRHIDDWWDH